jgi:cyanophycin synthetase
MNKRSIDILHVTFLRGPNIWTYRPVLEAWVDIGDLEDAPSNTIPGFNERLSGFLPGLTEHHCSVGARGGFLQRLREGTWPAHILEHVTIELQNLAGMQTGFGRARETGRRGVYKVAVRARYEQVSRRAIVGARDLVMAAIEDRPFNVDGVVSELRAILEEVALGPSTACIVDAAAERGIPSIRLNDGNLVQLGYGAQQRRVWTAETDRTSAIAESISRDKELTKTLLRSCGVPVPEGRVVYSPDDAWDAAEDIGIPVVVKPSDGNHGRGVTTNLTNREDVEAAYLLADAEGTDVIVEQFVEGDEHRLLIVGGRLIAAARGETVSVIGDGKATIAELVDSQLNTDPRRGTEEEFPLDLVLIDQLPSVQFELARQGFVPESVPRAGEPVVIQRHGNVASDVTDLVHPDIAAAAALAARVIGLDIAGIDLVAKDISKSLEQQGGAIVEVNAGPGLLMHLKPESGEGRPVGKAIAGQLFPEDKNGRIPVIGITGSTASTTVAQLVAHLLHLRGVVAGLACADGLYLRQRCVEHGNCANWESAQRLLVNRTVQAAVIENGFASILRDGLAYDRCQIGVVTDLDDDAQLPEFHIHDVDQMHKVVRTQVDVVLATGVAVLDADNRHVADLAPLCDGEVIFFSQDAAIPVCLEAHLAKNGRAVFVRDGQVVLATAVGDQTLMAVHELPLGEVGAGKLSMRSIVAAVGVAIALDIPIELIRAAIETFGFNQTGNADVHPS